MVTVLIVYSNSIYNYYYTMYNIHRTYDHCTNSVQFVVLVYAKFSSQESDPFTVKIKKEKDNPFAKIA